MASRCLVRSTFTSASLALLTAALPAVAQESSVVGVAAMPGVAPAVSGQLTVRESGPLSREIKLVYSNEATGQQVAAYDVELTQELHILAVDKDLNELVHEHVREASADGRFVAELQFPHAGTYHIYTDAVPTGLGQQVMRFDVPIGDDESTSHAHGGAVADVTAGTISSTDGDYTVELDASQLRGGHEGVMSLNVLKDGHPATDLAPYLGVAAHVVLIRAEDLAYVHAHALAGHETHGGTGHGGHGTPAAETAAADDHSAGHSHEPSAQTEAHSGGHPAAHGSSHDAGHQPASDDHDAHEGIMGTPGTIPAELSVLVTPPGPGTYGMWVEFVGGDQVVTVSYKIDVPAT